MGKLTIRTTGMPNREITLDWDPEVEIQGDSVTLVMFDHEYAAFRRAMSIENFDHLQSPQVPDGWSNAVAFAAINTGQIPADLGLDLGRRAARAAKDRGLPVYHRAAPPLLMDAGIETVRIYPCSLLAEIL